MSSPRPDLGAWVIASSVKWMEINYGRLLGPETCARIAQGISQTIYPYVRIAAGADLVDSIHELADSEPDPEAQAEIRELAQALDATGKNYLDELRRTHGT